MSAAYSEEHDVEPTARRGIAFDRGGDVVNQFDDEFREVVRRRRLAGEEEGSRRGDIARVVADSIVEHHDVQHVLTDGAS
jgi:hypothetical protein